jgi:RNA polymerase sigma factor (sigma-70 family)
MVKHKAIRPKLALEEELSLIKQANSGNQEAKDSLAWHNEGLVCSIANKYKYQNAMTSVYDINDLLQEGRVGLLTAIKNFKPSKKCRLTSFAYPYIKGHILRFLETKIHTINAPINKMATVIRALRDTRDITEALGVLVSKGYNKIWAKTLLEIVVELPRINEKLYLVQPTEIYNDLIKYVNALADKSGGNKEDLELLYKHYGVLGSDLLTFNQLSKEYKLTRNQLRHRVDTLRWKMRAYALQNGLRLADYID